ncbi:hypothetical protein X961_5856 [Burkholderia pseudomallei MSHR5613]|nr:hypothetical protein X961_5856 [Burkholderia pseudomallei MSHR5613]
MMPAVVGPGRRVLFRPLNDFGFASEHSSYASSSKLPIPSTLPPACLAYNGKHFPSPSTLWSTSRLTICTGLSHSGQTA